MNWKKGLSFLLLLRPQQWIKNLIIFFPIYFSGKMLNTEILIRSIQVFMVFIIASSLVYVFNDIKDFKQDQQNNKNIDRPLQSNNVSVHEALVVFFGILIMITLVFFFNKDSEFNKFIIAYLIINLFYTIALKEIPVLDISIISIGFLLRLFAGSESTQIELSYWLITLTILGSVTFLIAKRISGTQGFINKGIKNKFYSRLSFKLINFLVYLMFLMYLGYTIYQFREEQYFLIFSNIPVILSFKYYLKRISNKKFILDEELLLSKPILCYGFLWFLIFTFEIYLF